MRRLATHLFSLLGFGFFTIYVACGQQIDSTKLVVLENHRPQWASKANDEGPLPSRLAMDDLTLVLARPAQQEEALRKLLNEQQVLTSPNYHHWLTPAQMGERFGLSDQDMDAVTALRGRPSVGMWWR